MLTYTEELLGIAEQNACKSANNVQMIEKQVEEFVLGPLERPDERLSVSNSDFRKLSISGSFLVYEGIAFDNVVFEDISCFDMMQISSLSLLSNVRFVGNKRGPGLLIRPLCDPTVDPAFEDIFRSHADKMRSNCMVDITDFYGRDLEIIGLPIENVRYDPTRHYSIDLSWNEIPWEEYGIEKGSFWRLGVISLESFNATTAIYELPTRASRKYAQTVEELALLKKFHPSIFSGIPSSKL
jgi:hypothetical protein